MQRPALSLLLCALLAGSTFGQCFSVTTLTTSGNSQNGTMFNVVNISGGAITIGSFDQCYFTAGSSNMAILTKAGTWSGFETNPAAWTFVGSATAVPHAIAPVLDTIPIPVNVTIGAGATQAFYITGDAATSVAYTTGFNQLGTVIGSDASLQVTAGIGVVSPFGANFGLPTDGRLWNGRVNYCPGSGSPVLATNTTTGQGCIRRSTSFYENFATAASFDLAGTSVVMIPNGSGGWTVVNVGSFLPVGSISTPISLALFDDSEVTQAFTVGSFPGATAFTICSNGFVSVASGNGTSFSPDVTALLNAAQTSWRSWHDFNPAIPGSGQVKYEESATAIVVTWDGVWDFGGTTAANANNMQMRFYPNGVVVIAWGAMSVLGNGHLVGYSPGGPSADPGNANLSTLGANPIGLVSTDLLPLALAATSRPIINTNWDLVTSQIPATGVIGVDTFGIGDPGILDLSFLGMPGCQLRTTLDLIQGPWIVAGATHNYSFFIPNNPAILNVHLFTQSAVFQAPPVNAFGAITSNGIDGKVGSF